MNIKEGYIKKHIMSKVGEALIDTTTPKSLQGGTHNTAMVTYTPTPTHIIKKLYKQGVEGTTVTTEYVSYTEFNDSIRVTGNLSVNNLPTDCYRVEEYSGHYTYYCNFGTLIVKMFQRRYFNIGSYTQQELISEPAYREKVTVEFDISKNEQEVLAIRIYTDMDKQNRCKALEDRAMRIAEVVDKGDTAWMSTLSYWMKSITQDEPKLLAHVQQALSLKDYQGEES